MKTKKLVAFLVGAILLCTCIAGTLIFTASAVDATVYSVGDAKASPDYTATSIKAALNHAAEQQWAAGTSLEIYFKGTDASINVAESSDSESKNLIFGQTTIFRTDDTKLPISIIGVNASAAKDAYIQVPAREIAAANDYTFENLTFDMRSSTSTKFFAGSGEITFENVSFGTGSSYGSFYGDNFTQDAYVGWNALGEGEYVTSSITFGEGTSYRYADANSSSKNICAVGYHNTSFTPIDASKSISDQVTTALNAAKNVKFKTVTISDATAPDIRPVNTIAKIVIDPQTTINPNSLPTATSYDFGRLCNRLGYSPVAQSIVQIKSGSVRGIYGDVHGSTKIAHVGDFVFDVSGGYIIDTGMPLRALSKNTLYGNLRVDFLRSNNQPILSMAWIQLTNQNDAFVTGNVDVNISGLEFRDTANGFVGVVAGGTSTYNFSNVTLHNFTGWNKNPGIPAGDVNINIQNCTVTNYKGISATAIASTVNSVSVNIEDSKLGSDSTAIHILSNNYPITVSTNLTNTFTGCEFFQTVYAISNKRGTVNGKVTNTLTDCEIVVPTTGDYKTEICYFGAGYACVVGGGVENIIENSTFSRYAFGGGSSSTTISKMKNSTIAIKNTIQGDCVFHGFFAGNNSTSGVVDGDISTEIYGGTFGCYGDNYSKNPYGFSGGSRNYAEGAVKGNVTTTIYGGTFDCDFVAGIAPHAEPDTSFAVLTGKTVTANIYGGTLNKKIVTNGKWEEKGPHFETAILNIDPTQSTTALKILGEVIETSATTVNVTGGETIQIGKETTLVADTVTGASLTLEQAEEWIAKKVYFSHSANNATTLTAQTASGVPGKYEIVTEGGQQILRGSGTALTAARLVINSRVGLLAYVPKAEVAAFGDTFTVSFKLGSTELVSYTAAQIKALDTETVQGVECYAIPVSGVGPTNFANAISYSGTGLAPGETTIHELAKWGAENWEKDADKNLAKAIVNLGEVVTEVAEPTYSGLTKYTGSMVAPSREGTTVSSYALHLSDTIALKLKLSDVENLGVKVGDVDLVADETYLYDAQNSSLYVFINLARINEEVTVTILDGGVAEGSFTASISGVANAYSENAIADAILVLAQAVSQIPTSAN